MLIASAFASSGLVAVVTYQSDISVVTSSFAWGLCSGILNVSCPTVILTAFEQWVNTSNKFTHFSSRAAYASYLLHSAIVMLPLTVVWVGALRVIFGNEADIPSDWWIVAGGMFVSVLGLPLTWILSWYLCKIPGLKKIL